MPLRYWILGTSAALLVLSGSAFAAVISSHITAPSDPTFLQLDTNNASDPANTFTITGTVVDDGTPGNVDLVCYYSDGGMYDAYPFDPTTFFEGADLFYANDTYDALKKTGWTPSAVQVDGANPFGAAGAENVCGSNCALSGIPTPTVAHSINPANGNLTITESEPLVKCSPDPTRYPPTIGTSCTSFVPTGVAVNRTTYQYANGRQSELIDSYVSTDHAAHGLN